MKNLAKLTFVIFAITLLCTACSKSHDDNTRQISKEITAKDLVGLQLLEEFNIKAEYTQQYGDKPRLYVYAIKQGPAADVFHLVMNSGTVLVIRNVIFDSAAGITKIETDNGFIELTRDNSNNIIANKGFQFKNENDSKEINSKYIQIVKTNTETYNNKAYKAVEGINGYYRFSEARKWMYVDPTPPAEFELTWDYTNVTNTIWYGKDNGTAKYNNRFVIIPKGNGWKGQYKDKDLLLVHTWDNAGKVISNIAVCLILSESTDVDVYIVGTMNNIPTLWKNGVATTIPGAQSVGSVFVSKNNVYIAGRSDNNPVYWKNDSKIILPSSGITTDIFVNGNDVYVTGLSGGAESNAFLWKNGTRTTLSNTSGAKANSVYVYGTDVYVAGHQGASAVLWKNGTPTTLATGNIGSLTAHCVFVSGTDVYVGGFVDKKAIIWKNGVATELSNGNNYAHISSVFVAGNDVYLAGNDGGKPILWKNNTATQLSANGFPNKVFVTGNDVYVVGSNKLWKNGIESVLVNSEANYVFVVPKY